LRLRASLHRARAETGGTSSPVQPLQLNGKAINKACLLVICALSLCVFAHSGGDAGTVATIRALEHEWADAQANNNNRALDLIFDSDLVYVEYGRLVSKGEYLGRIKRDNSHLNDVVFESLSVRPFEKMALAVGTYREHSIKNGRKQTKRWRFVDTWVYKNGRWMLVAATAAQVIKRVDGPEVKNSKLTNGHPRTHS